MTNENSNVLCITGMHRSATSLAASWLQSCGLAVDDGRSLGPRVGNSKGHFEDKDFLELHHKAIASLVPHSGGWMIKKYRPIRPDPTFDAAARELIARRSSKFTFWGWKDPRTSLFLDQWKRLIPDLKVVLLWRPCAEVVESLLERARKDGDYDVPTLGAVTSWCAYNKAILNYKKQWPADAILMPVRALLAKDREAMELIQSRLCPGLQYKTIGDLYDPALLNSRPGTLWTRFASWLYKVEVLERELSEASDIKA
jgi:hypothetical protein